MKLTHDQKMLRKLARYYVACLTGWLQTADLAAFPIGYWDGIARQYAQNAAHNAFLAHPELREPPALTDLLAIPAKRTKEM